MNALFLGGNSPRHEKWIHDMADELASPFEAVVVHDYMHWKTGSSNVDMEYEVEAIASKMANLDPYIVFAKSIGTMITLKAISEKKLSPVACVFLGVPVQAISDMNLPAKYWLEGVAVPLYIQQQVNDPYGSATDLSNLLTPNIDTSLVSVIPGNTHDYNDTNSIQKLVNLAARTI